MRTDNGSAAPSPLQSFLRRWPLALGLGLVLAVLGYLLGGVVPAKSTAETRVAVGPGDLSAGGIAGFPEATRSMAEDYARWVTSAGIEQGGGARVSASPVPESNVIRIEAEASDAAAATQAAHKTAQQLVESVNKGRDDTNPDKTLATMQQQAQAWATTKTALSKAEAVFGKATAGSSRAEAAGAALTKAQSEEAVARAELEAQQEKYKKQISDSSAAADLRIISSAQISKDSKNSHRQQYAILGLVLGLLLTLLYATLRDRRAVRATHEN